MLQWGRDLSIAELNESLEQFEARMRLQWGRDLSIAEFLCPAWRPTQRADRFNGAAIYRSRNCGRLKQYKLTGSLLQWGRDLSIAEFDRYSNDRCCNSGFNGAAIYRSRNFIGEANNPAQG